MTKTPLEAITLLEELVSQGYMGDDNTLAKEKGVLELDIINLLSVKVDALTKLVSKSQINMVENSNVICEFCAGPHSYFECNATNGEVNFLQGCYNPSPNLNTYTPQWSNHLNLSWSNPSTQLNPPLNSNTKPFNPPGFPNRP